MNGVLPLDVDGLLVTADNPPRTDVVGMDHARCAGLHNYLVQYAWLAEGRPPASLHRNNNNTFFTAHGAAAEALRPRLDPSVAAFLDAATLPPADDGFETAPFFFWAEGLSDPDYLLADDMDDLHDEPEDTFLCLYFPNVGQGGEFGGGLLYHQRRHRAAVFMHRDDHDYATPVAAHPELWHPLETVLSNWIDLVRLGKIAAAPRAEPAPYDAEKIGPWEWRSYSAAQVTACVGAWDRLCDAVEALLPSSSSSSSNGTTEDTSRQPLLAPAALDAAEVPEDCFARDFLTRARRPRFRRIAPGLLVPPADAGEFGAAQRFTRVPRTAHCIPPVCLFPAAGERQPEADVAGFRNPFCGPFRAGLGGVGVPFRVPAGVYSESVERDTYGGSEEGFRLLLPYDFDARVDEMSLVLGMGGGARLSDGSLVRRGTATWLFQHGYKPFGGDFYRPQRLERLLDHWRALVEQGVWAVGPDGVEGSIDTFREADAERWREYRIPPTW
ncbi:hypothetical protein F5Y14DRAFT_339532 [Nemania sp. NC0429]|nr:hypothetical protein F5Y14DRAFT_339532 [Nemania sp. NC0429]